MLLRENKTDHGHRLNDAEVTRPAMTELAFLEIGGALDGFGSGNCHRIVTRITEKLVNEEGLHKSPLD